MKKIVIFLFIITILIFIGSNNVNLTQESIRIRLIANSNSKEDQDLKHKIRKEIETSLVNKTNKSSNIKETRQIITSSINDLDNIIKKYNVSYSINYGENYFPVKTYKGITFNSGNYESLVIKLGEAVGDNWWCVLFPPLCLMESEEEMSNVEYKFFFKSILSKF